MIYLYIKTHRKTGLKYFGKTTRSDPYTYTGSGKYWLRHLDVHGDDINTEIIAKFSDETLCSEFALKFSKDNEIVESDQWANLRDENGLDGAPHGNEISQGTRDKISNTLKGKPSPKTKYVMKESSAVRAKRSRKITAGTFWINDGITSKRARILPDGWAMGRLGDIGSKELGKLNSSGNNTRGKKIYNNGVRHAYFSQDQQPEGWVSGKMEGCQGGTGTLKKGKKYGE